MARTVNGGSQKQGHIDAAFNWCGKELALVGFGMNRMGAHFNPVSVSLVNAESKEGFCSQVRAQVGEDGALWRRQLASKFGRRRKSSLSTGQPLKRPLRLLSLGSKGTLWS